VIVDTSALVAILKDEPEAEAVIRALATADEVLISAASLVELYAVADSRSSPAAAFEVDGLLEQIGIRIVPFTAEHAAVARRAYAVFGKGSGSPARLNLGDCFSYALAAVSRQPLAFVGDDFHHTDIEAAIAQ
jgi:ribonuclease VapC